ncbi:MAG: cyanophycin synthetase, partial [Pseudomonadota bacterium]
AVAVEMGCSDEVIRSGFGSFGGVRRRFTKAGSVMLAEGYVSVIDDYAHHPVEIRAVLSAAREAVPEGRVIAVAQPHRYSRLKELMDDFQTCFNDADMVFVTPVYEAGEEPIEGIHAEALVTGLKSRGHRSARTIAGHDDLAATLAKEIASGDIIVCLGAGDITQWAATLGPKIETKLGA